LTKILLLIFWCLTSLPFPASFTAVRQTSNIQIEKSWVVVNFPRHINFNLKAQSPSEINQVVLIYGTNARTCVGSEARQQVEFTPAKAIALNWDWDLNLSGSLPPGVQVWWQWEIQDAAGNKLLTDRTTAIVEDNNYTWQTLKNNAITVYWSKGSTAFGQMVLDQAVASLDRLSTKAGLNYPNPVSIYVYPSAEDLKNATLHMPDWIGGLAIADYDTTIMGIDPNDTAWISQVVPHELSHLVSDYRIFNCSGGHMPTWLNEGLAMFAEGNAKSADIESLKKAIQNGDVPGLNGLTAGFAASGVISNYEYTYSQLVVTYLIDTYGVEKMDALLGKIKEGNEIDTALQAVYGVDTIAIDKNWRTKLGIAPVSEVTQATLAPTVQRTKVPTLALWTQAPSPTVITQTPLPTAAPPTATPAATNTAVPATPTPLPPANTAEPTPTWLFIGGGVLLIGLLVTGAVLYLKRSR